MAVAYYWNSVLKKDQRLVALTTQLSLFMLKENPVVGSVVLVDGSPEVNGWMSDACSNLEVKYLHAGKERSLSQAWNLGFRSLWEPYVGLMANDVLPHPPEALKILLESLAPPDVGCVFPYLTETGYPPQLRRFWHRLNQSCEPAGMTLTMNLFKRSVLEAVGGVDERYSAGYYDPIMSIKIRQLGFRVVQVGRARVIHLDRLTKKEGGSTYLREAVDLDKARFSRDYPRYYGGRGIWGVSFWKWPFSTTAIASFFWWVSHHFPSHKARPYLERFTMWIEPVLTRYPARYGRTEMSDRRSKKGFQGRSII